MARPGLLQQQGLRGHRSGGDRLQLSPEVQTAELSASNGIGTSRALARMYAALIGEVDGVRLLAPETLASATREQAGGKDQVMLVPSRFSAGYMLPTEANPMTGRAFGHTGRRQLTRLRRPGARHRLRLRDGPHRRRDRRCACGVAGRRGAEISGEISLASHRVVEDDRGGRPLENRRPRFPRVKASKCRTTAP
ncbi:serine hydrolase [Streptomyces sp900105245]|uniref:serine hydrolase n=1 Tax=Streptomyces sp. 900105245 TaxID=3154379 RepID=UPI0033206D15